MSANARSMSCDPLRTLENRTLLHGIASFLNVHVSWLYPIRTPRRVTATATSCTAGLRHRRPRGTARCGLDSVQAQPTWRVLRRAVGRLSVRKPHLSPGARPASAHALMQSTRLCCPPRCAAHPTPAPVHRRPSVTLRLALHALRTACGTGGDQGGRRGAARGAPMCCTTGAAMRGAGWSPVRRTSQLSRRPALISVPHPLPPRKGSTVFRGPCPE